MGSGVLSQGFSRQFAFDATLAIALASHSRNIGDHQQDLSSLETDICQAAVP